MSAAPPRARATVGRGADEHVRRAAEVGPPRGRSSVTAGHPRGSRPTNMSRAAEVERHRGAPRCRGRAPPRGRGADEHVRRAAEVERHRGDRGQRTCPPRCRGRAPPRGRGADEHVRRAAEVARRVRRAAEVERHRDEPVRRTAEVARHRGPWGRRTCPPRCRPHCSLLPRGGVTPAALYGNRRHVAQATSAGRPRSSRGTLSTFSS